MSDNQSRCPTPARTRPGSARGHCVLFHRAQPNRTGSKRLRHKACNGDRHPSCTRPTHFDGRLQQKARTAGTTCASHAGSAPSVPECRRFHDAHHCAPRSTGSTSPTIHGYHPTHTQHTSTCHTQCSLGATWHTTRHGLGGHCCYQHRRTAHGGNAIIFTNERRRRRVRAITHGSGDV